MADSDTRNKGRLSDAFARIVEGFIDTYLGDDKPITLKWGLRYVYAWFGIALFLLVSLLSGGGVVSWRSAAIFDVFLAAETGTLLVLVVFVLVSLLATVIASGIVRGGPIRLFLVGVTLPALVFYVATAATGAQADVDLHGSTDIPVVSQ